MPRILLYLASQCNTHMPGAGSLETSETTSALSPFRCLPEAPGRGRGGLGHDQRAQEGRVRLRLHDLVDQELRGFHGREVCQRASEEIAFRQLLGRAQELL